MSACLKHSASNHWPLGLGYRCSPHPPTWISVLIDFSFHWVWLWIELFVVGLRVLWSCEQPSAICLSLCHLGHSGCHTLYRVRGCTSSCRHHFRFLDRISFEEPFSQIQAIDSPPSWSIPTFHCRREGLGGSRSFEWWILSGVKSGSTADVCAVRRSTYLQSGFFVAFPDSRHSLVSSLIRDPRYTNSLTTSKCLSPIATLCPASKIVLSYIFYLFWLLFFPILSKQ
jgi:hypothetical protein